MNHQASLLSYRAPVNGQDQGVAPFERWIQDQLAQNPGQMFQLGFIQRVIPENLL